MQQNTNVLKPRLYIRADHDYGTWHSGGRLYEPDAYAAHAELDGNDWNNQHLVFEEFSIAGVNASHKSITAGNWDSIATLLTQDKPLILVSHVPYASEVDSSLAELSMTFRNKLYYWPSEQYTPYDSQVELMSRIYMGDAEFSQILAGHMHASWDGMLNEDVSQHIFGPAYAGNVGLICVTSD